MAVIKFYMEPVSRIPKQLPPQEHAKNLRYFSRAFCSWGYKYGQEEAWRVSQFYLSMLSDQMNLQALVTHIKDAFSWKCKVNREFQNYHSNHSSAAKTPQRGEQEKKSRFRQVYLPPRKSCALSKCHFIYKPKSSWKIGVLFWQSYSFGSDFKSFIASWHAKQLLSQFKTSPGWAERRRLFCDKLCCIYQVCIKQAESGTGWFQPSQQPWSSSTIQAGHSRWSPWIAKSQGKHSFCFQAVFQKHLESIQSAS